jgi:hypothetical protein
MNKSQERITLDEAVSDMVCDSQEMHSAQCKCNFE